MAVAKFTWHGTNPNKAFRYQKPPMSAWGEMVYFNATKAENEAAYNALVNHGPVSDFKTKVWNDICPELLLRKSPRPHPALRHPSFGV